MKAVRIPKKEDLSESFNLDFGDKIDLKDFKSLDSTMEASPLGLDSSTNLLKQTQYPSKLPIKVTSAQAISHKRLDRLESFMLDNYPPTVREKLEDSPFIKFLDLNKDPLDIDFAS